MPGEGYARETPNGPLSDLVGKMLEPTFKEYDNKVKTEARSTEDVKARIQDLNDRIKKDGKKTGPFQKDCSLVTVSLDFDAYFPSLDIDKCASLAKEKVENSEVIIKCDTNELSLFIACSHTEEAIKAAGLTKLVHRRRFRKGTRPGMTCPSVTGGPKVRSEDESWLPPPEKSTPRQKIKMLGMLIKYAIQLVMSHHYYTFNGEIRRQLDGGATGNSLTMELSRLFGL